MASANSGTSKAENITSPSRMPLLPRAFSNNSIASKLVRRKNSLLRRSDSTEDPLSPNGSSIYDAQLYSASDDYSDRIDEVLPSSGPASPALVEITDENTRTGEPRQVSITIPDIDFLYGNGTMLDTITEQKSNPTIGSLARTRSADCLSKHTSLTHHDSFEVSKVPRRVQSLSMDDLKYIKQSYHKACNTIESKKVSPDVSIYEIYAEPKAPIHAPIVRPSTPPGMPSWTNGQNIPPRAAPVPQYRTRLQRWFGHFPGYSAPTPSGIGHPYDPVVRPPRFRPPRSAYSAIDQHPFNRAPVARVPLDITAPTTRRNLRQRVRFTPSATARDSEMNVLRHAIESTSASALNPITPMEAIPVAPPAASCPHRSGRRALMRALRSRSQNHLANNSLLANDVPDSVAWQNRSAAIYTQMQTPTRTTSTLFSHRSPDDSPAIVQGTAGSNFINASTDHLMSGGSPENIISPKPRTWCWKCLFEKGVSKMDKLWFDTASCFCFVCCGYDIEEGRDEDVRLRAGMGYQMANHGFQNHGTVGFRYLDGAVDGFPSAPRRVVVDRRSPDGGVSGWVGVAL